MLDDAERRQVLVDFNATAQDYPHDRLIHQLFEEQAARTPQAIALVCDTQTLTYAELDARANRLAHYLIGLGVGLEDRVAMLLQRRISSVVAMLAVLKAGATYVPLDATYPPERVAQLLADCRPIAVVTEAACMIACPQTHHRSPCSTTTPPSSLTCRIPPRLSRASPPTHWPTSSTPPARPACPRASWSNTAASCGWSCKPATPPWNPSTSSPMAPIPPSMRRPGKSGPPCSMARPCVSSRTRSCSIRPNCALACSVTASPRCG
ncbi:AMP-binding protein [Xanthomonas sacchari]|nr:AMP-binding protein [Xanthomonas sacchari]